MKVKKLRQRGSQLTKVALALAAVASALSVAEAQENAALVDALVRKGILSKQEAEDIRADLAKEQAGTSAGKIKLSNSLSELKIYGDVRLRYQYDNKDPQVSPAPVGIHQVGDEDDRSPTGNQQSRWRFRLRLNADFKLGPNWFGGVELQTAQASDSAMQTYENGFNDYSIFISKAYLGYTPIEGVTFTAGKFANPFYTTELVWDADINPTGVAEVIEFHKLFAAHQEASGFSKDGKSVVAVKPNAPPWELTLVAGQFIFDDNNEGGVLAGGGTTNDNDLTTDTYLFETQLIGAYKFNKDLKLTVAPAWLTYISGSVTGADNNNPFNDSATVSGASRNLNLILAPGDLSFKLAGIKTKFYWDFSYNIEGRKRTEDILRLVALRPANGGTPDPDDFDSRHNNRDNLAWLVGLQLGENKKKGDWSILANYRETGIAAVDPNLNDSDFAQGELNTRGVNISTAYNFTDFFVAQISYKYAWNLRDNLVGGEATGTNAIADSNVIQVLQVDLNLKF